MNKYVSQYPEIKIKKNSITHDVLEFSKFFDRVINIDDLIFMNPSKFKSQKSIDRSILSLRLHGLIIAYDDNSWKITSKGIAFIYEIVHRNSNPTIQ